jgi:hypothetical protein
MEPNMPRLAFASLIVGIALLTPMALDGQPRASERGTVSQVVNGTTIVIDFSRPVARGRDNLFGGVVHWGEMWTPGANWATTLKVDRDVELNGHAVPAGEYSVWMQPQPDEWTVFLNREPRLYHDSPVPADRHLLSFTVSPQAGAHMETLAWYFPVVDSGAAELRMHWGPTYVPLTIVTTPYEAPVVSAAVHGGYVGTYEVSGTDPTIGSPLEVTIGILEEEGRLVGRWGPAPLTLVPAGKEEFYLGFMRDGSLFDLGKEMTLRMIMEGDRATAVEMLWSGEPFARGDRVR